MHHNTLFFTQKINKFFGTAQISPKHPSHQVSLSPYIHMLVTPLPAPQSATLGLRNRLFSIFGFHTKAYKLATV